MDKTDKDKDKAADFLGDSYRAEVKATGDIVRVVRMDDGEVVCVYGGGTGARTRLHNIDEITPPRRACPACFEYLDVNGTCPHARRHEYDAAFAASNNVKYFNRAQRRRWAARAEHLKKRIRRDDE